MAFFCLQKVYIPYIPHICYVCINIYTCTQVWMWTCVCICVHISHILHRRVDMWVCRAVFLSMWLSMHLPCHSLKILSSMVLDLWGTEVNTPPEVTLRGWAVITHAGEKPSAWALCGAGFTEDSTRITLLTLCVHQGWRLTPLPSRSRERQSEAGAWSGSPVNTEMNTDHTRPLEKTPSDFTAE